MKRSLIGFALLGVFSASAGAQRPLTLHIGGGASLPAGAFGDATSEGWHALAGVALSTLMQPIGLRLDVAHNRFAHEVGEGSSGVTSYTLNLTYRLPMTNSPLSPYVITGAGAYTLGCFGLVACGDRTDFGWNAGAGVKFAGLGIRGFIESRFHGANESSGNIRFVPLTLGVSF
jgi:hypothetical protein